MSIKDRLQMVMKMNNLTNASFADKVGVQRSSISHVMAGRNKPSLDFIQKTLTAFPRVNAQWLITGKQESIDGPAAETNTAQKQASKEVKVETSTGSLNSKEIDRIVVFYTDGTFVETVPGEAKTQ